MFWLQSLYFSFMVCIFFAQPFWVGTIRTRSCADARAFEYVCYDGRSSDMRPPQKTKEAVWKEEAGWSCAMSRIYLII